MVWPVTLISRPSVRSPTGILIACTGVDHLDAARQPVGGIHGDSPDLGVAEMLLDLADHLASAVAVADGDLDGVVDGRHLVREADVDHRPDHLDHSTCVHTLNSRFSVWSATNATADYPSPSAPATTSRISCVMAA